MDFFKNLVYEKGWFDERISFMNFQQCGTKLLLALTVFA